MVATELVEEEQQLEVRIIRTKGGIKNVAYIADHENSLIVKQTTSSAATVDTPYSNSKSNWLKNENNHLDKNSIYSEIPNLIINNRNVSNPTNPFKTKFNQDSVISRNSIDVEVEVKKVYFKNYANKSCLDIPLNLFVT